MRTVLFSPPLKHVSGGLAAIWELAEILARQGRPVALVCPDPPDAPLPERLAAIPRLPWDAQGNFLDPDDIWLVPEGWPNALGAGIRAGARCLVYVQNWAFMLSALPAGLTWKKLAAGSGTAPPLRFLAVSGPVRFFLTDILGLERDSVLEGTLPPAVSDFFFAESARPAHCVRVAFMPRKNKALAEQTRLVALALLEGSGIATEFAAVHRLEREAVAGMLASCHIFLSTGFPEGFALPPVEAMACSCVPVGFSGFGGFEYMRNPEAALPGLWSPPCPLERKPWGANGFFAADGDVLGAGRLLAAAVKLAAEGNAMWRGLAASGVRTAQAYNLTARTEKISRLWDGLESSTKYCP